MQTENLKALMYETQYLDYSPDLLMYETLLEKEIPVIEFGSGTGRISEHLLKCSYKVYGIEKEKSYSDYFVQKIKGQSYERNFGLLDNIEEATELCNIIFPFNVLFYLTEKQVIDELTKLKTLNWNKVIIETDNIHSVSSDNFQSKTHKHESLSFKEISLHSESEILIRNEVEHSSKPVFIFEYPLYLHKAKFLLSLFDKLFADKKLYGDFDLSQYNEASSKLIAIITT